MKYLAIYNEYTYRPKYVRGVRHTGYIHHVGHRGLAKQAA